MVCTGLTLCWTDLQCSILTKFLVGDSAKSYLIGWITTFRVIILSIFLSLRKFLRSSPEIRSCVFALSPARSCHSYKIFIISLWQNRFVCSLLRLFSGECRSGNRSSEWLSTALFGFPLRKQLLIESVRSVPTETETVTKYGPANPL